MCAWVHSLQDMTIHLKQICSNLRRDVAQALQQPLHRVSVESALEVCFNMHFLAVQLRFDDTKFEAGRLGWKAPI